MKVLITGNIGAGKSSVAQYVLAHEHDLPYHSIDGFRKLHGDGGMLQETVARSAFLQAIQQPGPMLVECMGIGDLGWEVLDILKEENLMVVFLDVPLDICLNRLEDRVWEVPYPGTPETAIELCRRSHVQFETGEISNRFGPFASGGVHVFSHVHPADTQNVGAFILKKTSHETA